MELKKAGLTYVEIADQLGYAGPSGAFKAVTTGLEKTLKEPAEELRTLEDLRLDKMLSAVWARVLAGDKDAIDAALKIATRRAKLRGIDAPTLVKEDVTYEERDAFTEVEIINAAAHPRGVVAGLNELRRKKHAERVPKGLED